MLSRQSALPVYKRKRRFPIGKNERFSAVRYLSHSVILHESGYGLFPTDDIWWHGG